MKVDQSPPMVDRSLKPKALLEKGYCQKGSSNLTTKLLRIKNAPDDIHPPTALHNTQHQFKADHIKQNQVHVLSKRFEASYSHPALGLSTHNSDSYDIHIPKKITPKAENLDTADQIEMINFKKRMDDLKEKLSPKKVEFDERYLAPAQAKREEKADLTTGHKLNRFIDIRANVNTAVHPELNANRIAIAGENIAIASQYPLPHQVENHIKMLYNNRTPVLVVLASSSEIDKTGSMLDYFRQSHSYTNGITTQSKHDKKIQLDDRLEADIYNLNILTEDKTITDISIPVIHVHNWPDQTEISAEATKALVVKVNETIKKSVDYYVEKKSRAVNDPNKLLPVIHCRAGVGRTGQLIAAMAMEKQSKDVSLEQIITDMRYSRNGLMVQTKGQLDILVTIAKQQKRALISLNAR